MNAKIVIELIGYIGSALVLVSMLMTSVVKLRVINLVGSIIFAAYALMIHSFPTAIMNICLAGVNIYHLRRLLSEQRQYDLIKTDPADGYISFLLGQCAEDIRRWFPQFSFRDQPADLAYLVSCDKNPACLFLGRQTGPDEIEIILDYSLPVYRDTSVGRFLYGCLAQEGYRTLLFRQDAPEHIPYMEKVGYTKEKDQEYVLKLSNRAGD